MYKPIKKGTGDFLSYYVSCGCHFSTRARDVSFAVLISDYTISYNRFDQEKERKKQLAYSQIKKGENTNLQSDKSF